MGKPNSYRCILRTSTSISFCTLVAAELAGTFVGLAYRIDISQQNLQMRNMRADLAMLRIISAVADKAFTVAAKRLVWWLACNAQLAAEALLSWIRHR